MPENYYITPNGKRVSQTQLVTQYGQSKANDFISKGLAKPDTTTDALFATPNGNILSRSELVSKYGDKGDEFIKSGLAKVVKKNNGSNTITPDSNTSPATSINTAVHPSLPLQSDNSLITPASDVAKIPSASIVTKDGAALNIPASFNVDANAIQDRVNSGTVLPQDIDVLSKGTGKTPQVINAYLQNKDLGMATDVNQGIENTKQQFMGNVANANSILGTKFNPDDILSSPDKSSQFLQQIKDIVTNPQNHVSAAVKENAILSGRNADGTLAPILPSSVPTENIENIKSALADNIRKLTADESVKKGLTPEQTGDLLHQRLDPVDYAKSQQLRQPKTSLQKVATSINPIGLINNVIDLVENKEQKNKEALQGENAQYQLDANIGLKQLALEKKSQGIISGDQNLIDEANTLIPKIKPDNQIIESSPLLMKQNMADYVNQRYANDAGILQGTEANGNTNNLTRLFGVNQTLAKKYLKEGGFYDNPAYKDIVDDVAEHPTTYFANNSPFGGAVSSFLKPFVSVFNTAADLTGSRTEADRHAENINDEAFPKQITNNVKEDISFNLPNALGGSHIGLNVANTINSTANLAGYAAIATATGGLGAEAGLAASTAERLGAWSSFGMDAVDSGLKEADRMGLSPAQSWLYAGMKGAMMAEGGRLFEFGKTAIPAIKGVNEQLAKAVIGISDKSITQDAAKPVLDEVANAWGEGLKKYGVVTLKGAATMSAFGIGDSMLKVGFNDPNTKPEDILPEAANSFFNGLFTMGIIGGMGLKSNIEEAKNSTYKGMLSKIVDNPDASNDVLKIGLDQGLYSQDEYNQKVSILNTGLKAKATLNDVLDKTDIKLTPEQRSVWIANKTAEQFLRNEASKPDIAESDATNYNSQADNLLKQSTDILGGLTFNKLLEPNYDLHNANLEHKQALADYTASPTDENEQKLLDKKNAVDAILNPQPKSEVPIDKPAENMQPSEISDTQILPTFDKVKSFIPEESLTKTEDVISKINNADNINVNDLSQAENNLYTALDKAPEAAHLIEPLILKIQNYPDEFKTKTETSTTTEKIPIEGSFASKSVQPEIKPALEQSAGSQATITNPDGSKATGTLNVKSGQYVLDIPNGGTQRIIGEKAITDRDLHLPDESDMENPIRFDKDGNVQSVTFKTHKGDLLTIHDPEKALDFAIQIQADKVGKIPDAAFDKVYQEVANTIQKEVPLNDNSSQKTISNENEKGINAEKTKQNDAPNIGNAKNDENRTVGQPAKDERAQLVNEPDKGVGSETAPLNGHGSNNTENINTNSEDVQNEDISNEDKKPPEPPQEKEANSSNNLNEWTRVNRGSLSKVKDLFRKVGISWDARKDAAMESLQSRANEGETLVHAASRELDEFYNQLKDKKTPRFNTEDQVAMHFLKISTEQQLAKLSEDASKNSDFSNINSIGADILNDQLDRVNSVLGAMRSESGVGLGYGTVEARLHPDYGFEVRQMQMIRANGGEPLNEAQSTFLKEQWAKEKDLMEREQQANTDSLKQDFDKQIADLKDEYEKKIKEKKFNVTLREKTLSQKGKDVADQIRKLKLTGTKIDFTLGTWNLAVEGIAKLVEGGSTIAEAINKLIEDKQIAFKQSDDKDKFESKFISDLNKQSTREDAINKIKDIAEKSKQTEITNDLVANNLIKDFVESHIGNVDTDKVLDEATNELKKNLPDITKEQVTEAYLKKGDFKQDTKRQLETGFKTAQQDLQKIAKRELTANQQQKIKLQSEKEKAIKDRDEFKRKLDAGEFETNTEKQQQSVRLNKADAELIKLHKERSKIESEYRKEQHKYQEKNKTAAERTTDTARSLWVMYLIGSPVTFAKIAWMALVRPSSEVLSKLTFGKVFHLIDRRISNRAKEGGESSSIRSIQKMGEAYFRQLGPKGLEKLSEKSEKSYLKALKKYDDYKKTDNPNTSTLKSLKKDSDNKMFNSIGNLMYNFIGGSSLKDSFQSLVNRSNEIERQFGKVSKDELTTKIKPSEITGKFSQILSQEVDELNYIAGFVGRSHSAAKTFSGRASFAAGFMARVESAINKGQDVHANKILEIAHESYLDWERGKYQQSNYISDKWNEIVNNIEDKYGRQDPFYNKYDKGLKTLLKTDIAITRVPVNIIYEEVAEYLLGAFTAPVRAIREYNKANRQAIAEGYSKSLKQANGAEDLVASKEFKERVKEIVSGMDEQQAARIVRCFRKGGLGLGLYATALIWGGIHFGIFPHKGQHKKKDDNRLKGNEVNPGQIMVGNDRLGETASSMIEHTPGLWDTFMGLGLAKIYYDDINGVGHRKKKSAIMAAADAIDTHLKIIEGNIPQTKLVSPTQTVEDMGRAIGKTWGLVDDSKKKK